MAFRPKRDVIIAVVHDVLKSKRFDSRADLRETVKERCAKEKIRDYSTERVEDAIDHVARLRPDDVPIGEPAPVLERPAAFGDGTHAIGQAEAASLVGDLLHGKHAVGPGHYPEREPLAPLHERNEFAYTARLFKQRFRGDRAKAARLIAQEIAESIARCEALEAAVVNPEPTEDT